MSSIFRFSKLKSVPAAASKALSLFSTAGPGGPLHSRELAAEAAYANEQESKARVMTPNAAR